jgi:hypothetical protein
VPQQLGPQHRTRREKVPDRAVDDLRHFLHVRATPASDHPFPLAASPRCNYGDFS